MSKSNSLIQNNNCPLAKWRGGKGVAAKKKLFYVTNDIKCIYNSIYISLPSIPINLSLLSIYFFLLYSTCFSFYSLYIFPSILFSPFCSLPIFPSILFQCSYFLSIFLIVLFLLLSIYLFSYNHSLYIFFSIFYISLFPI